MASTRLFLLITIVIFHGPARAAKPAATPAPEARVERKLDGIIIPRVEIRDGTLTEAVDFLRKAARRCDPQSQGVPIAVQLDPGASAEPAAQAVIPGAPPNPDPQPPDPAKLTLSLRKISLREALRYVAGLANMKIWVRSDGVHLVPVLEPEPMLTRVLAMPADLFPWLEKQDRIAGTDTAAKARNDFQEYLVINGVLFPNGASALLNPRVTRLTVHNTKEQLELIKYILDHSRPSGLPLIPGPDAPKVSPASEASAAVALLKKKMAATILHNVVIKEMSLRDAVRTLRQLSIRYDLHGPRKGNGVTVLVEDPESSDENVAVEDGMPISYAAKKVSLLAAVEAVAKLSGRKMEISGYAVCLIPKDAPDRLVIWEFLLPPNFVPRPISGPPTPYEVPDNAKNWLISGGINFPQPPSAVYIASSRRLIVRETVKRLKLVEQQIEAAWREYYATHPPKKKSRR